MQICFFFSFTKNIYSDVPAQPHGRIIFDSIEADNVTIAWQEPLDNGGTNITGYVVHYRPIDQESWSPVTACTGKRRYKVRLNF